MRLPGFHGAASLYPPRGHYLGDGTSNVTTASASVRSQAFGGFGPTLPSCHYEKRLVVCGSALPGYPVPMCWDWVYICTFPGSSRNVAM